MPTPSPVVPVVDIATRPQTPALPAGTVSEGQNSSLDNYPNYGYYGYDPGSSYYGNYPDYGYGSRPNTGQTWYYCSDPAGYYPYVAQCNIGWQAVPAS